MCLFLNWILSLVLCVCVCSLQCKRANLSVLWTWCALCLSLSILRGVFFAHGFSSLCSSNFRNLFETMEQHLSIHVYIVTAISCWVLITVAYIELKHINWYRMCMWHKLILATVLSFWWTIKTIEICLEFLLLPLLFFSRNTRRF